MVAGKIRPDVSAIPVRTCKGCGRKRAKQELFRFALSGDSEIVLDRKNRQSGRGVYCCRDKTCLESFVRKSGKLARAFRTDKVNCGSVQSLVDSFRR
jgi:predicted RNA-binding protein YlxR (DUF448 family)